MRIVFFIILCISMLSAESFEVKIRVIPKDSRVIFLDNKDIEYSENMNLDRGQYRILVYKKGYSSQDFILEVNSDIFKGVTLIEDNFEILEAKEAKEAKEKIPVSTTDYIPITKEEEKVKLTIGVEPKNADVTLLNHRNIKYKWGMSLRKGEYKIRVHRRGYRSEEFTINLQSSEKRSIKLKRETYTLKIVPQINGKKIEGSKIQVLNILPKYHDNIRLNANVKYEILVSKSGYYDKLFTNNLSEDTVLKVRMVKKKIVQRKKIFHTLKIRPTHKGRGVKADIKILNIKKKYKKNVLLKGGVRYKISVYRRGCKERIVYTTLRSNENFEVKLHGKCR